MAERLFQTAASDQAVHAPRWLLPALLTALALAAGFMLGALVTSRARSVLTQERAALAEQAEVSRRQADAAAARTATLEAALSAAEVRLKALQDELTAARAYADGLKDGRRIAADSPVTDGVPPDPARATAAASQPAARTSAPADPEPNRCTAITKAGTRRKRQAEPGSDRCWQHKK